MLGAAALGVAALVGVGALAGGLAAGGAHAAVLTNCAATPSNCGYPGATNTGVPSGTTLKSVPGQVSSGPGWHYNAAWNAVIVNRKGAVLSGLYIPHNLRIDASNVTVKNVHVVTNGNFGISLTHTTGVTIEKSTISGQNATTGRVDSAIDDVYGDSTGTAQGQQHLLVQDRRADINRGSERQLHPRPRLPPRRSHQRLLHQRGHRAADDREQHDLHQPDADRHHQPRRGNLRRAGGEQDYREQLPRRRGLLHLRRHLPRQPHLTHPHRGQPVRPAVLPTRRPLRPRRLLRPPGQGNAWSGNFWDTTGKAISSP